MDKDSDDRQIKGLLDIILNSELSNAEIRPRGNCKFSVFRILGYLALRSRSSLQKFYGGHHAWPLWNFHISNDNVSFRSCIIFVSFVLFVFLHIVVSDASWLFEKHGGCLIIDGGMASWFGWWVIELKNCYGWSRSWQEETTLWWDDDASWTR
jgi:hypothetical protein